MKDSAGWGEGHGSSAPISELDLVDGCVGALGTMARFHRTPGWGQESRTGVQRIGGSL